MIVPDTYGLERAENAVSKADDAHRIARRAYAIACIVAGYQVLVVAFSLFSCLGSH